MNILITGATGFVGRHLCNYLLKQGHNITKINSTNCDLTDKNNLVNFSSEKYDRIYHLAVWTKAGDFCLYHKGEQWLINQQINTNVLWYWRQYQPQAHFITFGTSCAYSPQLIMKEENYMAGEPDKDLYTYAMTKRMLYEGVRSFNQQFGMTYTYLIPNTLYGPDFDINDSHFIFDLIKKIYNGMKNNKEVRLWGDGNQIRELIYIDDLLKIVDFAAINCKNDVLNVGCGKGFSIKQYANIICNILGYDNKKIQYDINAYVGVYKKILNIEKLNRLTTIDFTPIDIGIKRTIDNFLEKVYEMQSVQQ